MKKILKASAGTGKTYRLSLEFVASLLRREHFEEIVVMTFTRKATAEIRERVFEHIEDILSKGRESSIYDSLLDLYPEIELDLNHLRTIYNQMLKNKDKINIYTIDSFINKIFKKVVGPYLGVYTYEIIEDEKNSEVIEEVFKELLDQPDNFNLMEKFLTENTERDIKSYLGLIQEVLDNRWKFLLIEHKKREERSIENLTNSLDRCIDILESIARERGENFSDDYFVKQFKPFMADYINQEKVKLKEEKIIENYNLFLKKSFWNGHKTRGKNIKPLKEDIELEYNSFIEQLAGYLFNKEIIPYEEEIFKLSTKIFEIYDQIKFKKRVFTHTDISNYTYKYLYQKSLGLLNEKGVSKYFFELIESEVKSLFIDEFQDTSILQWKILKPLINSCQNFIAVGDEKQSIYGWRGGEKKLFSRLEDIVEGESETLSICYRSEKEILNFVNRFFLNIDFDWNYKKVEHLPEKDSGFVEVIVGGESCKNNTESDTFQKLNEEMQKGIIELNGKLKVNLKEEIANRIKKLPDYRGVGVLARSNKDLVELATELDRKGIPYILESKDSIVEHEAVKPLYFLLKYLYYKDFFQLIKFLRSDLVGINNKTLKYLLNNKAIIEEYMNKGNIKLEDGDLVKVLEHIKKYSQANYLELTNLIFEDTGIIKLYHDNSGAMKNIYHFFKLMRSFNTLADFMKYIEDNIKSEELKQVGVNEENAVNLMTIHKSKGLSFETEFLYWNPRGNNKKNHSMEIYVSFDDRFEQVTNYLLSNSRYEQIFELLGYKFAEEKNEKEIVEEINNIYVALTRPIKNLFIYIEGPRKLTPGNDTNWKGSSYDFYERAILNAAGVDYLSDLVEGKSQGKFLIKEEKEEYDNKELPVVTDYFAGNNTKFVKADKSKEYEMDLDKEVSKIEGLAIHYYLEHVDYNTTKKKDFARKMVLARFGNILGPGRINNIFSRVENFIDNHDYYFEPGWQVYTEYEVKDGDKVYRIDRLLVNRDERKIVILDYKSGITREKSQIDKYREIVEDKTGGRYSVQAKFVDI